MKIKLNNVGVVKKCDVEFVPGINLIVGSSGSGKSTLMRSIYNTACNNFSDGDISFGENTMDIAIENNGNTVEYSRTTRQRSEHCYYKVNGETYVKLGRQPLPAVTNVLKIGDICINGDDINFNFNLQFSTPFLIMGSQSTLYNVLTYRSTCDVASINEYYESDVKANASEINSNMKVKDRLVETLDKLKSDADKLSPIEDLYSKFVAYKHEDETLSELNEYANKFEMFASLHERLLSLSHVIENISKSLECVNTLLDLNKYTKYESDKEYVITAINNRNAFEHHYDLAEDAYNRLMSLHALLLKMCEYDGIVKQNSDMTAIIALSSDLLENGKFVADIASIYKLGKSLELCMSKYELLSKLSDDAICTLDDLIVAHSKICTIDSVNASINEVLQKHKDISDRLSKFEVCPLCGKHLSQSW